MTQPRHAVAFACDEGYAPHAFAAAAAVAALHPARGFDILVLAEAPLAVPERLAPLGLLAEALTVESPFQGGDQGRHGHAAYLRLLIPDHVAGRYDRVLYLDSDVLCAGPGLDRLLGADLGGRWLGAVRDNIQWRTPGRLVPEFRAVGQSARPYLNSGVLLIDVAAWRAAEVTVRAVDLFRGRPDALTRHDQSILNILADGGWAEMSPVWNWQYTRASRFFAEQAEPRLLHFIGRAKPWAEAGADLPARYRRAYGAPDAAPGWPDDLRASLLRHWRAAPAMERYLRRFPDPYALQ